MVGKLRKGWMVGKLEKKWRYVSFRGDGEEDGDGEIENSGMWDFGDARCAGLRRRQKENPQSISLQILIPNPKKRRNNAIKKPQIYKINHS